MIRSARCNVAGVRCGSGPLLQGANAFETPWSGLTARSTTPQGRSSTCVDSGPAGGATPRWSSDPGERENLSPTQDASVVSSIRRVCVLRKSCELRQHDNSGTLRCGTRLSPETVARWMERVFRCPVASDRRQGGGRENEPPESVPHLLDSATGAPQMPGIDNVQVARAPLYVRRSSASC
jgi:hypothetical protein